MPKTRSDKHMKWRVNNKILWTHKWTYKKEKQRVTKILVILSGVCWCVSVFFFFFFFFFFCLFVSSRHASLNHGEIRLSKLCLVWRLQLSGSSQAQQARSKKCEGQAAPEPTHGLWIAAVPLLGHLVSQPLEKRRSRGAGTSSGREHQRCEGAPLHVSNTIFIVTAFVLLVRSVELFQGAVAIWARMRVKHPNVKICALMSVCTPESSSLDVQPCVVCGVGRLAELLTIDWLEDRLKAYIAARLVEKFSEKVSDLVVA